VYVWGRGEYGRLGLGDRSGSSKLRATKVTFKEPDLRVVQARTHPLSYLLQLMHFKAFIWCDSGVTMVE
jgi:hypothetical protein